MRSIAGTFTFMWLIAAAVMPAKESEAGQPEKSQGGTMQTTQPNIQGRSSTEEYLILITDKEFWTRVSPASQ